MEKTQFEADENEIVSHAARIVINAYRKHQGAVPDLFPFQKPLIYDNLLQYEDSTLDILVKAINAAMSGIFHEAHPETEGYIVIKLPSDVLERIVWTVFGVLKLLPVEHEGQKLTDFELSPEYGTEGYIDMKHNRISKNYERLQEIYDTLIKTHARYLNERFTLLEEFTLKKKPDEYEALLLYIEQCCQKIAEIRAEILRFCHGHAFINPFSPPEKTETTSFEEAIHWNDSHAQGEDLESFDPSDAECSLYPFLPKDFHSYEWPLFHFEFTRDDSGEDYSQGDIHSFRENQYERKMVILYYARLHLSLHRNWTLTLSPQIADTLKKNILRLEQEFDDVRRIKMNGGNDPEEQQLFHEDGKVVTYDITGIDDLCTRAQNIVSKMDVDRTDVRILNIFQLLTEHLSVFLSNCIKIRTDDSLDNTDKADIIATFREELLHRLNILRDDLSKLSLDHDALDSAGEIIENALKHLSQY